VQNVYKVVVTLR